MNNHAGSALILEGGAMRGMFTCGVLDVLMEQGVIFEAAAGISAGAVFGINYKSGQIGRAFRYNRRFCGDVRYGTIRSLIRTGDIYDAEFCYHELPDKLDPFDQRIYRENPMEFHVGATDVRTGKCVYRNCMDGGETDIQWIRASASMPLVSRPVEIGDHLLLDGGISDAVPYMHMESMGFHHNVIVLTQPKGYIKRESSAIPAMKLMLRRYPELVHAMQVRHEMYNRQMADIDAREKYGISFLIRPPEPLAIGRTEKDPKELERVYRIGRAEATRVMPDLQRFLSC